MLFVVAGAAMAARPLRAWRSVPPTMSASSPPPAASPQTVRSQAQERAELALATLAGEEAAPPEQQAEAIKALAEAGDVDQCLKLLRGLRRTGCAPTLESYGHVVTAFSRAGRPRDADRWMRRVVQPELGKRVLERSAAPTLGLRNPDLGCAEVGARTFMPGPLFAYLIIVMLIISHI